ncbi:orotidine-5'-phosphate decarboxylase [Aeromicrobium stalagmiti]|uniref:orotidine-5'-phosphate decarboxylase n=1 Tax=Aeromicrobium stalagmiti TaxID=2738988 RepID=UPI001567EC6B|nr:orotidine-5'-phosphate decarboxylase [Aeromicrobium stalagmiti]NRQ50585.1 orotidine-5'-phosphate decarboxylase [Aeromicrobium stalagmiti]
MSFGSRARVAMQAYGPACIGIDPHPSLLEQWGLEDDIEGLDRFASICVEAFAGQVAFVKPQSAFFERFGARGVVVLERTIEDLRHTGSLVVLDVKRGDIGSTAQAYADAYLDDDAPMAADAITVSPFLGFGSLAPFFDVAEKNDAGVFVLALTSNPEGPEVQHARNGDRTVAGGVLAQLAELNAGATPMGSYGAVVGATIGDATEDLAINGPLLVPGFGAQGGTVDDVRRLFGGVIDNVIPSTSRGVLAAGPDVQALRDSAARVNAELVGS